MNCCCIRNNGNGNFHFLLTLFCAYLSGEVCLRIFVQVLFLYAMFPDFGHKLKTKSSIANLRHCSLDMNVYDMFQTDFLLSARG